MPTFLYPLGFLITTLGLMLWTHYDEQRKYARLSQLAFVIGLFVYIGSLFFAEVSWMNKIFLIFRDMLALAIINWVLMILKPKTIFFWAMTLLVVGGFFYFVARPMSHSLAGKSEMTQNIEVDTEGEWLVEMDHHADLNLLKNRLKGLATFREAFDPISNNKTELDDYLVVNVLNNDAASVAKVGAILKSSGQVDWVEANEVVKLWPEGTESNIKINADNLGVNDPETNQQWAMEALGMKSYYAFLRKQKLKVRKKVKLAILDTGVDSNHEDLKDNYVSTEKKSDNDPQGHGTHCAGIASAVTNNGIGIASFGLDNQYYSITSIKVLNASGMGTQESIIDGIIKAADAGVAVISMSLGGRASKRKQTAYEKAVNYANKKGAIVIVAAGNENRNATTITPANVKGVITVSAIDSTLTRAQFSNNVADVGMGIAAPGVAIYSTLPNNQYKSLNGTSMATPYVAGLVAMMKAINPKLKTKEIYKILSETGKKTRNPKATGKLIQPRSALAKVIE